MSSVTEKAIHLAIRNLSATGCKYLIITPDGTRLGDEALVAAVPSTRKHRKVNHFAQLGYAEKLAAMQVGDVCTFAPPPGVSTEAYQKVLSAKSGSLFGSGAFITSMTPDVVEVLRTA
jgi:hypothetical protein